MMKKIIPILTIFFSSTLTATFYSEVFQYDDPAQAKGLHYTLMGQNKIGEDWQAHEVKENDIAFHQKLFLNPQVMAYFSNGQLRDAASTDARIRNQWMPRSHSGHPHSGMTVFIQGSPVGHIVAGGGDEPGASEVAYSFMPENWGKGLAGSVVKEVVTTWAPETRRIGLGVNLDESESEIQKAFQCFGDKALSRLDATSSPDNPGSLKL